VRAKLLAVRGIRDRADQTAREAVALAERTDDLFTLAEANIALAEVLQLAGRWEEAIAPLKAAVEASDRKGNVVTAKKARTLLAGLQPAPSTQIPGSGGWPWSGAFALAARRQSAPWLEWILIGLAVLCLMGGRFPAGTLAFGRFFIGAVSHEFSESSRQDETRGTRAVAP
jgi:hypothetical protein